MEGWGISGWVETNKNIKYRRNRKIRKKNLIEFGAPEFVRNFSEKFRHLQKHFRKS